MKTARLFMFLLGLTAAALSNAEVINLKCQLQDAKSGTSSESWVAVDTGLNVMRVMGSNGPLSMTNDSYSTRYSPSLGFVRSIGINRQTGSISIATLYEGQVIPYSSGTCEKAEPPAAKF